MVARKSALIVLNTFVGGFIGALAIKLTAAYFGKEIYGQVGYALGIVGLLYMVTDLGFHGAHVKRLSEGTHEEDALATFAVVKVALTSLLIVLVLGMIGFRVGIQGKDFVSTSITTLLVVAGYYVFRSLYFIGNYTFEAKRATVLTQSVLLAENTFRFLATAVVAYLFAVATNQPIPFAGLVPRDAPWLAWVREHGAELVAVTWLLGAAAAFAVSVFLLFTHHRIGRFDVRLLRSYWRFAFPVFLLSVIGLVSSQVDRVIVGYFWGDDEVGAYFGAQRITGLVEAIPAAVGALLFPTMSALSASQSHDDVRRLLVRSQRYILILTLPLAAFLIVFGESVFSVLLSNEWRGAGTTLSFLTLSVFFYSLLRPYIALMAGYDRPAAAARIGIVMSVVNLVLTVLLVPADIKVLGITLFGLRDEGAALGLAVSAFVGLLLGRQVGERILGPIEHGLSVWKHVVAGGAMVLTFWLLHQSGIVERVYVLAAFGFAGALVYLLALVALREFTRQDFQFFWGLANPRRFVKEAFDRSGK